MLNLIAIKLYKYVYDLVNQENDIFRIYHVNFIIYFF